MDTKAFKKLDYSLALAATAANGKSFGCIVNSLHQVTSASPQKFSLSLNNSSATKQALDQSGVLSVTLIGSSCPETIINEFGYKSGRAIDKFAKFPPLTDAQGCPYLTEGMVARLSLRVLQAVPVGTHTLFICEAVDAEVLADGNCMTVFAFEQRGREIPAAAPIVRELAANAGWRCTVCGFVNTDDTLPDNYVCPICGAPHSKFEKR